jgi:hypothetical protein
MEYLTRVNGSQVKDKVKAFRYGLTIQNILENGKIIKLMERVFFIIQMGIYIKVNG